MTDTSLIAAINCNGQIYTAWDAFTIRRDYGNGISVFTFSAVENAYGKNYSDLKLQVGDSVTITLAGQLALTGLITERSVAYDGTSHQVVIAGKSTTAAANDSSVKVAQGGYNGYTFEQAAKAVLKPLNINLIVQNGGDDAAKPFANCGVQFGEKCSEFISRLAMQRGLFITDNAQGDLVASRLNDKSGIAATFREGENILRATAKEDYQGVAGQYTGVSQAPGSDEHWPSRSYSATSTNGPGPSNILNLFVAEHPAGSSDDLVARVRHEVDVMSIPLISCTVTTPGWLTPSGQLWDPSMQASVYSPMIFSNSSTVFLFGIQSVTFSQDNANGSTTTLEMCRPQNLSSSASSNSDSAPDQPQVFSHDPKPDTPDTSTPDSSSTTDNSQTVGT